MSEAAAAELPILGYLPAGVGVQMSEATVRLAELFEPGTAAGEVAVIGHRILERRRLQRVTGIVGETDAMREVLERVVQIAPVASTVLITGESGTGKELVARGIHHLSPRRHKPFIAVSVAALSDTLLESELFGHEKGAFTGAIDSRKGFFELAEGGTIFLDEISEMPPTTQTKLLRVLEQREFHRVGGEKLIRVDVRIIAATNQDLGRMVTIREFRKDLYYRLNVLRIELPPLRQRREDIRRLVAAFVEEISLSHDRTFPRISAEAMAILEEGDWPGNVRELKNLVESMVVLAPGHEIQPSDLPPDVRDHGRGMALVPALGAGSTALTSGDPGLRPQLEFVFRTLVDLRVDVDDLRTQFEAYLRERRAVDRDEVGTPVSGPREIRSVSPPILDVSPHPVADGGPGAVVPGVDAWANPSEEAVDLTGAGVAGEGAIVFRSGMTMQELEREAILTVLREVRGNRRKAAERLGIGERTLYRKLHKYGLEGER